MMRNTILFTIILLCASSSPGVFDTQGATPLHSARSGDNPELNFTYLDHDAVSFGSTAFRVWDDDITIFIEAFPNVTACDWDPETIKDADIIIQNHHGHASHYDADECATVAQNTGAYVVGNAALKKDMTNRGVPSSQFIELSPALGGKKSATIASLGVTIHSYGMIHTMMTSTKVDTYLVEMPSGITWYHGTCSSESATMNYMSNYPELKGIDVMIADTDMNFGTLNTKYYPETLIKDHDFNYGSTPIPATVYESYPSVFGTLFHNQTYRYTRPDYVPSIEDGNVDKDKGLVDTEFDFSITYRYRLEEAPTSARIVIDSQSHNMTTTDTTFRTGAVYHYRSNLSEGPHDYHFEFNAAGLDIRYPAEGELEGPSINYIPTLDSNIVDPEEGDDDMDYTFSVTYTDNDGDMSDDHYVVIDGQKRSMMPDGTDYMNGVVYSYTGRLSVNEYSYHFEFTDGNYQVRFPAEGEFEGPTVIRANYAPRLSGGNVEPLRGDRLDDFTFSVNYRDSHGDIPIRSQIFLDGEVYNLSAGGPNYKTGVVYSLKMKLGLGTHSFHFEFEEGPFSVRFPQDDGVIEGPLVENIKPDATIDNPVEMDEYATTDRIILNASSSTDPEGDEMTFNWESDIDGELGEGEILEVSLSKGQHIITLNVDDGNGGTSIDTVVIIVIHYEPILSLAARILPPSPEEGSTYDLSVEVFNSGNLEDENVSIEFILDGDPVFADKIDIDAGEKKTLKFDLDAVAGDHVFEVRANEDMIETFEFSINERPPPLAVAGEDKNAMVGDLITFDGSGSDSVGFIENFTWLINGTEYYGSIVQFRFEDSGTYNVTLTITDEIGKTDTDHVMVTINEFADRENNNNDQEGSSGLGIVLFILIAVGLIVIIAIFAAGFIVISKKKNDDEPPSNIPSAVNPPLQPSNTGDTDP